MKFKQNLQYTKKSENTFLDKKAANIIKGIAILLMLIHHFWGFPNWITESNKYLPILGNYYNLEIIIGAFGKICVSMFAFITGYAIYINRAKYANLKYRLKIISKFLLNYWIFAFGFIIIGFLINENLPNINYFIANLFGLATGVFEYKTSYICVTMAWYVSFYIFIMLILPLLLVHTNKGFLVDTFLMSFVFMIIYYISLKIGLFNIPIIGSLIRSIVIHAKTILIGYYISQYNIFDIINNSLKINCLLKIILGMILCILIFLLRALALVADLHLDYIYATFFIFGILLIYKEFIKYNKFTFIEKIILSMGRESLNLWFIHSIFFTPERKLQFIAYWPKNSIFILIWVVLLLLPLCKIITKIQQFIWYKINKKLSIIL